MENYIAKKILEDANIEAQASLKQARQDSEKKINKAKQEIEDSKSESLDAAQRRAKQASEQAVIIKKTQERKENLNMRQTIIDDVFEQARKKLLGASAAETQKFVGALVKKFAKPGDTIYVSKHDEKKITDSFLSGLSVKKLVKKTDAKFEGGIILENDNYTLRLTLDDVLSQLRSDIELEVAKILF